MFKESPKRVSGGLCNALHGMNVEVKDTRDKEPEQVSRENHIEFQVCL